MNTLIYVLGTPNSGTSCVAGILYHLGVDMGELYDSTRNRGYMTFECQQYRGYRGSFREYLNIRLRDGEGPQGIKCESRAWEGDDSPETLPVRILAVNRPLEDAIASSRRLWQEHPFRRSIYDKQEDQEGFLEEKASGIRSAHNAKTRLLAILPAKLELDFYDVLADSAAAVESIRLAFGLVTTPKQIRAAIGSVQPEMRHV